MASQAPPKSKNAAPRKGASIAPPITRDAKASAALFRAIANGSAREVQASLSRGARARTPDAYGATPLMRACSPLAWSGGEESTAIAELLLPLSAPLATDEIGQSALMHAALWGSAKNLALLLPFSDPLACSEDGRSALLHAAWRGNQECVRLLLPVSLDRAQDHNGMNALMIAVTNDSAECIPLLLPHADLTARDRKGLTAFDMARASESPQIAEIMLSAEQALCLEQTLPRPFARPKLRAL